MQNRSSLRILVALLLLGLILFSFIAFIQKQSRSFDLREIDILDSDEISFRTYEILLYPSLASYLPVSMYLAEFDSIENNYQNQLSTNSTRTQIFEFVKANPGVSFRGICSFILVSF